jgi:very-short-patch-repair endonuclease
MEITIIIVIVAVAIAAATTQKKQRPKTPETKTYHFQKKEKVMTYAEGRFFEKLTGVIGDRFIVIPQAHLSVFIDQHVKGQNWKAAFRVINGKSVDFLLVEKTTLKPIAAIELDDWSHKREDRVSRDEKVKAILDEAGVLLVRFDSPDISGQTIVDTFYHLVQGRDSEIQK